VTDGTAGENVGRRRLDRVLAPEYLDGLPSRSLDEVRRLRAEAEQEETDLSFFRRILHGRIDILQAELDRRTGGTEENLVAALPKILSVPPRPGPHGLGRHHVMEPSEPSERWRGAEVLVGDVNLVDLGARTDDELRSALTALNAQEAQQSENRRAVQRVVDACSADITRRYRTGEASVSDLLSRGPAEAPNAEPATPPARPRGGGGIAGA
jgi:hypothetical protein